MGLGGEGWVAETVWTLIGGVGYGVNVGGGGWVDDGGWVVEVMSGGDGWVMVVESGWVVDEKSMSGGGGV